MAGKPTLHGYQAACQFYHANLARTDEVLYDLCRQHPCHWEQDWVHTKVLLIGRGFASGIERQIPKPKNKKASTSAGYSIWKVSQLLHTEHEVMDGILQALSDLHVMDRVRLLSRIAIEHKKLCKLLSRVTKKKRARSFAAKYLHFHCPQVPMFDTAVYEQAWKYRPRRNWRLAAFRNGRLADGDYACYLQCFHHVYRTIEDLIQRHGTSDTVSIRRVEVYLAGLN